MTALIKKLLDVVWDQWDHHKAVLHEGQVEEVATESSFINAKIQQEFKLGPSNLPLQMSFLFRSTSYEDLMGMNLHYRRSWLTKIQAACQQAVRQ